MVPPRDLPNSRAHRKRPAEATLNSRNLGGDVRFTFWMRFFRLPSLDLSAALASKDALTFALTFCRRDWTNFTLTSDSNNADVISLRVASRTLGTVRVNGGSGYSERTFSSTTGARFRDESAAFSFLPKSARTIECRSLICHTGPANRHVASRWVR
jgi:hypothetical protein